VDLCGAWPNHGRTKLTKGLTMAVTVKELWVQMQINRSNATAGGSGANVFASAIISVLVTHKGAPVADLGDYVGDQHSAVSLPTGWSLIDGFNVAPGGSVVTVTEFINQSHGLYDIRIVPFIDNPASTWLSGEYIFAVNIHLPRRVNGKQALLQGSALAKLTIL
jgi:hypothetical protein